MSKILDTIPMWESVSNLFVSQATFRLLRCLSLRETPVTLRSLARIADLPIHSVENALAFLRKEKVTREKREKVYRFIELNPTHPLVPLLRDWFLFLDSKVLESRVKSYGRKPEEVLAFMDSAGALLRRRS